MKEKKININVFERASFSRCCIIIVRSLDSDESTVSFSQQYY